METNRATVSLKCPKCENTIIIDQAWTPGGLNDYGGFVLQCEACDHIFDCYLGRDIQMSHVESGAKALDTYDNDVEGDRTSTLAKYGLEEK